MYDQGVFGDGDLITNTAKRVPVCLCLDVSGSMSDRIDQLNDGVEMFYQAVKMDETALQACEIAVVTFESEAKLVEDFEPVDRKVKPNFTAGGGTDMGAALTIALRILEERKQKYREYGTPYRQPWLVVMSDGYPAETQEFRSNIDKIKEMERNRKLTVFPVGIGKDYSKEVLGRLSVREVMEIEKPEDFAKFFQWLSMSVSAVATGGGPIGWVQ